MRVFELTSTKNNTILFLTYDRLEHICGLSFEGDFDSLKFSWAIQKIDTIHKLKAVAESEGYPLIELGLPIPSFADFWAKYNLKKDKKKAEAIWNRLREDAKIRAFQYIEKYKNDLIRTGFGQKMAKTYLQSECWYDEK